MPTHTGAMSALAASGHHISSEKRNLAFEGPQLKATAIYRPLLEGAALL